MTDEMIFEKEFEAEEKKNKVKEFLVKNKWKIVGGTAAVVLTVIIGKKIVKKKDAVPFIEGTEMTIAKVNENDIPVDSGRDCVMKFFVEETGEFLGEDYCTETFVNDILGERKEIMES